MQFRHRLILAFLAMVTALPLWGQTRDEFVQALRERLYASACPLTMASHAGASVFELKPHHLYDLERVTDVDEAEKVLRWSVENGSRCGGKTFHLGRWPGDVQVRHFIRELDRLLAARLARDDKRKPFYLNIVGLGREAAEVPLLVELVDEALERLKGERTKEALVAELDLHFGFYDVDIAALDRADGFVQLLAIADPWTKDRLDVRFHDMTVPLVESMATWFNREIGLVMARNSLRDGVVERGWPLLKQMEVYMPTGGLLVVDYEAAARLAPRFAFLYPLPEEAKRRGLDPERLFEKLGGLGRADSDEDENVLFRRR